MHRIIGLYGSYFHIFQMTRFSGAFSIFLIGMVMVGSLLSIFGLTAWREAHPIPFRLESTILHQDDGILEAVIDVGNPGHCLRRGQHQLVQPATDIGGPPIIIPVGSALNGEGFPPSATKFRLWLMVPTSLHGDWYLTEKVHYECWPFGLVRMDVVVIPPTIVHFEGNDHG